MNARTDCTDAALTSARRFEVRGIVQGVGFRPRVVRLARTLGITGRVCNAGTVARIEACGSAEALDDFESRLRALTGGGLRIDAVSASRLEPTQAPRPDRFEIDESADAPPGLGVAPDWASCAACVAETLDPFGRRYRYPFTACTECGPRLSVFGRPPYDRAHTSLAPFTLCADCEREYRDADDRRFHAQAIGCQACGPRARLQRVDGRAFALDALSFLDDVDAATSLIGRGEIVLVKGLGGYQLACDATNAAAVTRLRELKHREAKPFALVVRDLDMLRAWCEIDAIAVAALTSAAVPIVLLPRRATPPGDGMAPLVEGIAPSVGRPGATPSASASAPGSGVARRRSTTIGAAGEASAAAAARPSC